MVARAVRFDLHLGVRYRQLGQTRWRDGHTENISRSGVLFHVEEPLAPHTPLAMVLLLPGELTGSTPASVLCTGQVVRGVPPEALDAQPALAATISGYRFLPGHHAAPDETAWSGTLH